MGKSDCPSFEVLHYFEMSEQLGNRVTRKAKKTLDELVGTRAMTKPGMDWLICSTDPFHDDRVRCPGYPDTSTVNSVVQTYTTTASISAPNGQTAAWDLHVPYIPVTGSPVTGTPYALPPWAVDAYGGMGAQVGGQIDLYGGFNAIVCATSGTDWYVANSGVSNSSVLALPPKYASGHYRQIAVGIEAVNTTASLYKGGSLTVYRAPSSRDDGLLKQTTTIPTTSPITLETQCPVEFVALPPSTQAEAAVYTDSRTWSAEDGAYVVVTQSNEENPFLTLLPRNVAIKKVFDSTTVQQDMAASTTRTMWSSILVNVAHVNTGNNCSVLPFDNCGMILTGLNPNSTIQLTVRYYIERVPATSEPDLLSMCQVPPAYDAVALEIYSRCLAEMPVGVPQNENPLGEWFEGVLESIKSVAPKIGGFISNLGNAVSMVGGQGPVQSNATPQRQQNNAQKKQQKQAAAKAPSGPPPSYAASQKAAKRKAARQRKKAGG